MHHNQRQQRHKDLYQLCDVILLNQENIFRLQKRREVMYVVFYDPDDESCRQQEETFKELANKNYDYFGVAAVNCRDDRKLCRKLGVQNAPKIFLYPQNITAQKIQYVGPVQENKMKIKAFGIIENFIEVLNQNNIQEFWIRDGIEKVPVILFSEKKVVHPMFKILSKMHKNSIKFGLIKNSGSTFSKKLIQQFKVNKYPTVILVKDKVGNKFQLFNDEFKRQNLSRWISQTVKKAKTQKQNQRTLIELTKNEQEYNSSCTKKDKKICIIFFKNSFSTSNQIEQDFIQSIGEISNATKLRFAVLDVLNYSSYYSNIVQEVQVQNLSMIVIKGKAYKYKKMQKVQDTLKSKAQIDRNAFKQSLKEQIQEIISGGARYKKFKNFPTIKSSLLQYPQTDL